MAHILIIEDEPGLRLTLADRLQAEGHHVTAVIDAPHARHALSSRAPIDLILLDIMLPGEDGVSLCRSLRADRLKLPILMLTALQHVEKRVEGLNAGADDYLGKPFAMAELMARVDALLRRFARSGIEQVGCIEVDRAATRLTRDGQTVNISALLYDLLIYFLDHRGQTLTRQRLLKDVWKHKADVSTRTVDVHVAALRRIVEEDPTQPRRIVTVHGRGYRFDD